MGAKEVELPADLKLEAGIQSIDAQLRGGGTGSAAAASKAAEALGKSAPGVIAKDSNACGSLLRVATKSPSAHNHLKSTRCFYRTADIDLGENALIHDNA